MPDKSGRVYLNCGGAEVHAAAGVSAARRVTGRTAGLVAGVLVVELWPGSGLAPVPSRCGKLLGTGEHRDLMAFGPIPWSYVLEWLFGTHV